MKSSLRLKFLAAVLAVGFALFAGFGAVLAATSDPYLYPYDGNFVQVYTYILPSSETTQEFYISPSDIEASDAPPSFFDSSADVMAVAWNIILDTPPSLSNAVSFSVEPLEVDTDQWLADVTVTLPNDGSFGSLSVKATNPGAGTTTNVTLVRNEADDPSDYTYTSADLIAVQVYDPGSTAVYSADQMVVQNIDFYETPPNIRSFPTGLDGLSHAWLYAGLRTGVTAIDYQYVSNTGDFVQSMTIDGTEYPTTGTKGWQYRVYRNAGTQHDVVPLSEFVGADSFMLRSGDIVLWKYAEFESPGLFPDSIQ
jgi:hypothetical protein